MENIIKNTPEVDVDKINEAGHQVAQGASDTVKTISDYFGVDTLIIWFVALVAIAFVWRVFRKLGKIALVLIIIGIIVLASVGTLLI